LFASLLLLAVVGCGASEVVLDSQVQADATYVVAVDPGMK